MATTMETAALEQWLRDNRGFLHPRVKICHNDGVGVHWRADAAIDPQTTVSIVPHSLALSYLNALVDDGLPAFSRRRQDFRGVENIGFFYLMAQYISRTTSFWQPYLETLPKPESTLTTPLWFDAAEDLAWLEGTDVLHTMLGRKAVYEDYYRVGVEVLEQSGVDTHPYTWDLFRWAVTMFTSRSFSSRAITPQDSKYWTTYKSNAQGRRQTVLLDMSKAPAADLDFPVLFPVLDAPNHHHDAHVDWEFAPGRFSVLTHDRVEAGAEVFNNYGGKGNAELLLGYGFCVPENPHDGVLITLKPPPEDLRHEIRKIQPGYFTTDGSWNSDRTTFRLVQPPITSRPDQVFENLPEPLLELLLCILRHERGLSFTFHDQPFEYISSDANGRRYLPHIARMIVQSLAPKLAKLHSVPLPSEPQNEKQTQASIYRQGQARILESLVAALRSYTRSLLQPPSALGSRFVTLEGLLELWSLRTSPASVTPFIAGVEACSGTADVDQLREAGWEEDVVVILLCYIRLSSAGPDGPDGWARQMLPEYVAPSLQRSAAVEGASAPTEDLEHAANILELVHQAREAQSDSQWNDARWTEALIVSFGKMLQYESMVMMVPRLGGNEEEEARLVVYLHSCDT